MACDADVKSTLSQQHSPGGVNYVDHGRAVHLNGLETAAHMAEGGWDRFYARVGSLISLQGHIPHAVTYVARPLHCPWQPPMPSIGAQTSPTPTRTPPRQKMS